MADAIRQIGVSEETYYRWRAKKSRWCLANMTAIGTFYNTR
jgi:hypothetical protein